MAHMLDPWIWLVYALAVARLTGLVTVDTITEPIRDAIVVRLDDAPGSLGSWFAYLITCPWCASVWIGTAVAITAWHWGSSPFMFVPALALAFSFVSGALSNLGR